MAKDELVIPGDFLAYGEEYVSGQNCFEDEEGNVHSDTIGQKLFDNSTHEVSVQKKTRHVKLIERGTFVIGVVGIVRDNVVIIDLKEADFKGDRRSVSNITASLMVSNIANEYVNSTSDMYRVGDIVRAHVLDVPSYGIELETKSPDLGVIKAFGVRSREPLILINGQLRDTKTGATESRKVSTQYSLR